ncbi:MAG: hypothetical protein IPH85_06045 [Ignavibacteria bacterium]|nr:hypothetical protein [Ignavibacteria bacterium]
MSPLHLGFACAWNRDGDRERTWSHTPMRLWDALERRPDVEVLDVPIELPRLIDSIGRISSLRLVHGRTMSTWAMRPWYARLAQQALSAAEGKVQPPDAILSIGEHGSTVHPLYIYQQDLSQPPMFTPFMPASMFLWFSQLKNTFIRSELVTNAPSSLWDESSIEKGAI